MRRLSRLLYAYVRCAGTLFVNCISRLSFANVILVTFFDILHFSEVYQLPVSFRHPQPGLSHSPLPVPITSSSSWLLTRYRSLKLASFTNPSYHKLFLPHDCLEGLSPTPYLLRSIGFWATVTNNGSPYATGALSCLSVCNVGVLWPYRLDGLTMPLGTEVGLGSGDIVLDGDPAPPSDMGTAAHTFRLVYCGQTVARLSTASCF